MLTELLDSFFDELEKLGAASSISVSSKVLDRFSIRSWGDIENALKDKKFQRAAIQSTKDPKLKDYLRSMSLFENSKDTKAEVASSSTPGKVFEVRKLRDGRLGCSCNDWRYVRSLNKTDCKHIKKYKDSLQGGGTP